MKKILTVLLVLLITVLVPITAFAAANANGTTNFSEGEGATNFQVEVNTANISVTVPLNLVFVADANGGALGVPAGYAITNNSTIALKVTNIATGTLTPPAGATATLALSATAQTSASATKNVFQITLNDEVLTEGMNKAPAEAAKWNITAKGESAGTCAITVAGSSAPLDFSTTTAATLFQVTYTIAPA